MVEYGRRLRKRIENVLCRTEVGYRAYLRLTSGVRVPMGKPGPKWRNTVLKLRTDWETARSQVRGFGTVEKPDPPRNWHALSALAEILQRTGPSASVLDAGTEFYSPVLPSLPLCGCRGLIGIIPELKGPVRQGPIRYDPGNLAHTRFDGGRFDRITCLGIIEQGVDLDGC
jgi:hypothetical protein